MSHGATPNETQTRERERGRGSDGDDEFLISSFLSCSSPSSPSSTSTPLQSSVVSLARALHHRERVQETRALPPSALQCCRHRPTFFLSPSRRRFITEGDRDRDRLAFSKAVKILPSTNEASERGISYREGRSPFSTETTPTTTTTKQRSHRASRARARSDRARGARARCKEKVCAAERTKGRGASSETGKGGKGRGGGRSLDVALCGSPRSLVRRPSAKGNAVARAPPRV